MSTSLTVGEAIAKSAEYLRGKGVDSPRLDAELLLAHVLECDRLKLYLHWDKVLDEADKQKMRDVLQRRGQQREPVARIVGQREFYGRPFHVGKGTFVPRPETEWLVERAVEILASLETTRKAGRGEEEPPARPEPAGPRVVDIGTGTGCIAISIALERPETVVYATDISEDALRIARDNASVLGAAARVRFHRGDLFAGLQGPFDLVVSNPPYIAGPAIEGLAPEVAAHDPHTALDGGRTGVEIYRRLADEARSRMNPRAHLLLEIGEGQGHAIAEILETEGMFESVRVVKDLAGLERYVEAVRSAVPAPPPETTSDESPVSESSTSGTPPGAEPFEDSSNA